MDFCLTKERLSYSKRFYLAYEKSQRWKLGVPRLREPQKKPVLSDLLPYRDSVEMMLQTNVVGFGGQCGAVHFNAAIAIHREQKIDTPYITIGDVFIKGEPRYRTSYQKLKKDLRQGLLTEDNIDCHVWLTFPDMSIFDLSLGIGLAQGQIDEAEKDRYLILGMHEKLFEERNLQYVPYLVGKNFLFQSGMLNPPMILMSLLGDEL